MKEREPPNRLDARVGRKGYESQYTYGQRMHVLLDGMWNVAPDGDVIRAWDRFDDAHRALFVVMMAMGEIENGALHQLFWNSTGDLAPMLPVSARFFAADNFAEIFDQALALFDPEQISERSYRIARLDELEAAGGVDVLDQLTDEIHNLEDDDAPIYAAIARYIEEHPTTFFT